MEAPHVPVPALQPAPPARSPWKRARSGLLVALLAVLKYGKLALLALPKLKLLTTSGTMLVSIAAYSLLWGWTFALGFVLLLLVHEMGHVIQLRREGIPASAPVFVPFLGAVVSARSLGDDAAAEARVGLAGPVLGSLGAAVCLAIYGLTGDDFWRALAYVGFFLNLFNLIPVTPLDGGRAMAALSPWMWFAGLFGMFLLVFAAPNGFILLFALIGTVDVHKRFKAYRASGAATQAYYRVPGRYRLGVAVVYFGLAALLAIGMHYAHLELALSDV